MHCGDASGWSMSCTFVQQSEHTEESLQWQVSRSCKLHSGKWQHTALMSQDAYMGQITSSWPTWLPIPALPQTHVFSVKWFDSRKPSPAQGGCVREVLSCPPQLGPLWHAVHTPQDHANPAPPLGGTLQRAEKQKLPFFLRVSSVKKHCLAASHTSCSSPLFFDLGVVKRQEPNFWVHILSHTLLRHLPPNTCACLEWNEMGCMSPSQHL